MWWRNCSSKTILTWYRFYSNVFNSGFYNNKKEKETTFVDNHNVELALSILTKNWSSYDRHFFIFGFGGNRTLYDCSRVKMCQLLFRFSFKDWSSYDRLFFLDFGGNRILNHCSRFKNVSIFVRLKKCLCHSSKTCIVIIYKFTFLSYFRKDDNNAIKCIMKLPL